MDAALAPTLLDVGKAKTFGASLHPIWIIGIAVDVVLMLSDGAEVQMIGSKVQSC